MMVHQYSPGERVGILLEETSMCLELKTDEEGAE
jgi:hypothetical protein